MESNTNTSIEDNDDLASKEVIEAFRGVGKSWIAAAAVLWVLLRDPNFRWLIVSASASRSDAFSIFCKQLIHTIPLLNHLKARKGQRDSNLEFEVGPCDPAQAASVRSVGINGMMTGARANGILADDVEIPNNSDTPVKREQLANAIKEFKAILSPDLRVVPKWWREDTKITEDMYPLFEEFPMFLAFVWRHLNLPRPTNVQVDIAHKIQETVSEGNCVLYLGTPQTEDSIYNRLPDRGYNINVWPARFPNEKELLGYGNTLAPFIRDRITEDNVGTTTDPQRFTDENLNDSELEYGKSGFSLQFMLNTQLSDQDKFPLKLSDLIVTSVSPHKAPSSLLWSRDRNTIHRNMSCDGLGSDAFYKESWKDDTYVDYQDGGMIMYIDPSGRGQDETSYSISGFCNGWVHVSDFGGLLGGYDDDTLDTLILKAKNNKVNTIWIENNFGDGMFSKLLESRMLTTGVWSCAIEERRVNTQKETRIISTLEPIMNQHKLVINQESLEKDFTDIPTKEQGHEKARMYRLAYQMSRLQKAKGCLAHDDRLDALEGSVWVWTENMNRDTIELADMNKRRLIEEDLQNNFLNSFYGSQSASKSPYKGLSMNRSIKRRRA